MEAPKRKHVVHIEIGADSWQDVLMALRQIQFDIDTHEPGNVSIVSGGYSCGYTVKDEFYPEQTHDNYFEQSQEWLKGR